MAGPVQVQISNDGLSWEDFTKLPLANPAAGRFSKAVRIYTNSYFRVNYAGAGYYAQASTGATLVRARPRLSLKASRSIKLGNRIRAWGNVVPPGAKKIKVMLWKHKGSRWRVVRRKWRKLRYRNQYSRKWG